MGQSFTCRPQSPWWAAGALAAYAAAVLLLDSGLPPRPSARLALPCLGEPCAFSGDGRALVTQHQGDGRSAFRVWDWRTGQVRSTWEAVTGSPQDVLFSPDGALLAVLTWRDQKENPWGIDLRLWDVAAGEEAARWLVHDEPDDLARACFSPDGTTLAFTRTEKARRAVYLWDLSARRMRAVLEQQAGPLAFSPDGRLLATTAGTTPVRVKVWDVRTGGECLQLQHPKVRWGEDRDIFDQVLCLAFCRDGGALGMIGQIAPADEEERERVLRGALEVGEPSHVAREWDLASGAVRTERLLVQPAVVTCPGANWEGVGLLEGFPRGHEDSLSDPLTGTRRLSFPARGLDPHSWYCGYEGLSYTVRLTPDGRAALVVQHGDTGPEWRRKLVGVTPWLKRFDKPALSDSRVYETAGGRRVAKIGGQAVVCLSPDGRLMATSDQAGAAVQIFELPPPRPWCAILGWAALPAALIGLLGRWYSRRLSLSG
jgi:hypothetical protein